MVALKTAVAEEWALRKGFGVRRIDRMLRAGDAIDEGDPTLVLCGVDSYPARRQLAGAGFEAIVDAGLGRTAADFDLFRVTLFHGARDIALHFEAEPPKPVSVAAAENDAYAALKVDLGACGFAEVPGAATAVPNVSAIASAVTVSRAIAIASRYATMANEIGTPSRPMRRSTGPFETVDARGILHAGRPSAALGALGRNVLLTR